MPMFCSHWLGSFKEKQKQHYLATVCRIEAKQIACNTPGMCSGFIEIILEIFGASTKSDKSIGQPILLRWIIVWSGKRFNMFFIVFLRLNSFKLPHIYSSLLITFLFMNTTILRLLYWKLQNRTKSVVSNKIVKKLKES